MTQTPNSLYPQGPDNEHGRLTVRATKTHAVVMLLWEQRTDGSFWLGEAGAFLGMGWAQS